MRRHRLSSRLLLLAAGPLLAGCVAAAQPDPGSLASPAAGPSEPVEVRLHLPAEPATLDPAHTAEAALIDVVGHLTEGLVAPGGTPEAAGGVAERWESAARQVEWLREAGFADAQVWWEHDMWAVFGGRKE